MEHPTGDLNLEPHELTVGEVHRNLAPRALYEPAIRYEKETSIAENGALVAYFGVKTGRSPKDKRVVKHPDSAKNVSWGPVNGGAYGTGKRISLKHTRAIIDEIHDGALPKAKTERDPILGFDVPTECPGVPRDILKPRGVWADVSAYDARAKGLAGLFRENFKKYESGVRAEIKVAGPA